MSEYANSKRAADLPVDELMVPVDTVLKAQFITASAAARQMLKQGSGVIIFLTGSPARPHTLATSRIGAANGAVENLTRDMAIELSPAGVRVVCLRTSANPDSRTIEDVTDGIAKMMNITRDQANASLAESTLPVGGSADGVDEPIGWARRKPFHDVQVRIPGLASATAGRLRTPCRTSGALGYKD